MSKRWGLVRSVVAGLGCAAFMSACAGGGQPFAREATVYSGSVSQPLTAPSKAAPLAVVSSFLQQQAVDTKGLRVKRENFRADTGLTHLRLEQEVDGLRIVGAYAKATVTDRGELVHLIEKLAPATQGVGTPAATETEALGAVMAHLGYGAKDAVPAALARKGNTTTFAPPAGFYEAPTVERVAYVDASGKLVPGFHVQTWTQARNQLHHTLVDGAANVVSVEKRSNTDSYNVFVKDPQVTPQAVVSGPGAGNVESPSGWLAGAQSTWAISGNNVNAYLDADGNNRADRGGTAVANGNFLAAADFAAAPSTTGNRNVAVQNLFYLNNVVHDILYRHGFTEGAGNFQVNNFGKGGSGNDPVQAEAQDGSGTDNANFSTPSDGQKPRMQMYLWTGAGPSHEVIVGAANYPGAGADFGAVLTTAGVSGALAVMAPADGCTAATASLTGKIAIIDRGTCNFDVKVKNAQLAGAKGAIIANHAVGGDSYFNMAAGTAKAIKIGAVMVGYTSGTSLKGSVGQSATERKKAVQPLQIDGDLDSGVVFHEYGHGLTWRMIGGMDGTLAGAIGEGASDTNAFLINGDPLMGVYAFSNAAGIRRHSYAGYPLTYKDVTGAEVHDDGEIYAAAMWRVRELFLAAGASNDLVYDLFVDGMNYTPATPRYEDMRDGMLRAAANRPGVDACNIWKGFAQFGIGVGAVGVPGATTVTITESFVVPASCQ